MEVRKFGITIGITIALIGFLVFLFYGLRPMWHGLFFFFYRYWPAITVFVIWIVITAFLSYKMYQVEEVDGSIFESGWIKTISIIGIVVLFAGAITFSAFSASFAQKYMVQNLEYSEISAPPEITDPRFMPLEIASVLANAKQEDSSKIIYDIDPIEMNGEFIWLATKIPNGLINEFKGNMDSFIAVDADGNVTPFDQKFKYGEGMEWRDDIYWQMYLKRNMALFTDPYYYWIASEKEFVGFSPYVLYRFQFPVMVPYWGGVMVFHADGQIEDLTPQQAVKDERFKNVRMFPEYLALVYTESYAYYKGINNARYRHEDQIEVPTIQDSSNQMPYLLFTNEGTKWMIATIPFGGTNNQALIKIFWFDVRDGSLNIQNIPKGSKLTGPNIAADYIKSNVQRFWEIYDLIEARPIFKFGEFYWMFTQTIANKTGISSTFLINPVNNQVIEFTTKKAFDEWFETGIIKGTNQEGVKTEEGQSIDYQNLTKEELLNLMGKIIEILKNK